MSLFNFNANITLGQRFGTRWGDLYPFFLTADDRRRHLVVLGQTGVGKSTALKSLIKQDILAGRGVAYIDPHGEDAEELLHSIPSWRANDVIYFNAGDFAHPMAWNLLSHNRLGPAERDRVASIIVSGFEGIFGDSWGPNLEYVLLGCLHTLLARGQTSILGVQRLITERDYRAYVLRLIDDPGLTLFWRHFEKQEAEHKDATNSVINKVGRLFLSPTLRNIFGQTHNTINPRRIMDERKILIVNLAKGIIGDEAARLIGASLIAQFFAAALSRADMPEAARPDFSLVIDEFTTFGTTVIGNILSEARKYRLSVCAASQFLGQIDEATEQAIFGNVGTVLSFRVGEDDAALLARHYGNTYAPQSFATLDNHTVLVKQLANGIVHDPFLGYMAPFACPKTLDGKKVHYLDPRAVIRQSRRQYTERREVVEAKLARWMMKTPAREERNPKRRGGVSDEILRQHATVRGTKKQRNAHIAGLRKLRNIPRG